MKSILDAVATGRPLGREDAEQAFGLMMDGEATPSQIGAFLMGLRVRGEALDEIAGAVAVMRRRMTRVEAPADAIDIVGTGGDASGSYNVSTCAAIVAAAAGLTVAKHGNRALSSRSGAADTLEALGVNLDLDAAGIGRCIKDVGLGFMFAPNHHAAMRHVGPSRAEMGVRTIFNLLGPLSNPAGVRRQVVGVYSEEWIEPLARVLGDLGCERAWVVHGDGLDELTVTGETEVCELRAGDVRRFTLKPEDAGLARHTFEALGGGDAQHNAVALRAVLDGEPGAYRDITLMNAGAALVVGGSAADMATGADLAAKAIDSGAAAKKLADLVAASRVQHR